MTEDYESKVEAEKRHFTECTNVHELPGIFHYWSHTFIRPMVQELGCDGPDQFFAKFLYESCAHRADAPPAFISIGSGNCDTEVRVAMLLKEHGLDEFSIECLDLNPTMLARGSAMAAEYGVERYLRFVEADFNRWRPTHAYDGVMANQSLHHVLELEHLFAAIRASLAEGAYFVVGDTIGRNGHQRWPEALQVVRAFWEELPLEFRQNLLLSRFEMQFEDWDCSSEGFEGIRAQEILPLLLETFHFRGFLGFGNVIDPFVDRCFGHHFDPQGRWDRRFIDRVHAADEAGFRDGTLKPTHMMAVLQADLPQETCFARGLSPSDSVRHITKAAAIVSRED